MPPKSYRLSSITRAQASTIHEQHPGDGLISHHTNNEPTLTQWCFSPDRSALAIQRIQVTGEGLLTPTELAHIEFDDTGNVANFTARSEADSPPLPRKTLGLFYLVKPKDRVKAMSVSHETTTRLIEFVFKNLDDAI